MKVIHTGDWHLGQRFYNYEQSEEEGHFFRQLEEVVVDEQPDALLVCGDIYHTGAPGNDVAKAFTDRLLSVQSKCPSMEIIVIAGNHDSYSRLEIDRSLWRRCHVHVFGTPAEDAEGNADFAQNVVVLDGKGIVAAVPFCHPRNFPACGEVADNDRMGAYFSGLRRYVEERNVDGLPTVLMAHLAVGVETDVTGQERGNIIGGEECVEQEVLGTGYDYIALGHIHCPQWIKGARKTARYCGTPRPIHFDETYPHGVDVLTIEAGNEPELKIVDFNPLRKLVTFGGRDGGKFDDVLKEFEQAKLDEGSYVRLNVALAKGEAKSPAWDERARAVALDRGMRFCVNNLVRETAATTDASSMPRLTMEELKELSDEEVLTILNGAHELSDRQRELLSDLMAEIAIAENI